MTRSWLVRFANPLSSNITFKSRPWHIFVPITALSHSPSFCLLLCKFLTSMPGNKGHTGVMLELLSIYLTLCQPLSKFLWRSTGFCRWKSWFCTEGFWVKFPRSLNIVASLQDPIYPCTTEELHCFSCTYPFPFQPVHKSEMPHLFWRMKVGILHEGVINCVLTFKIECSSPIVELLIFKSVRCWCRWGTSGYK